jgi:hypothetical protein
MSTAGERRVVGDRIHSEMPHATGDQGVALLT